MSNKHNVKYFQDKVLLEFGDALEKYDPDKDLPYMVFGSFALLVNDLIKSDVRSGLLSKATALLEEMAGSEDKRVHDLFLVGFLEVFADENASVIFARKNFNKTVNRSLDRLLDFWGKHSANRIN